MPRGTAHIFHDYTKSDIVRYEVLHVSIKVTKYENLTMVFRLSCGVEPIPTWKYHLKP